MSANPRSLPAVDQPEHPTPIIDVHHVWRLKWRIAATTLLFISAAAGYIAMTPVTYEVSSRVLVREDNPSLEHAHPAFSDSEFLATQAEVIRSPLIIREALNDVPVSPPENYEKGDVAFVLESLAATPIIQTDVLKISYRGHDPQQAKDLVAAMVARYEEHVQQDDKGRHAGELDLLAQQEAVLHDQLERLQDAHTEFRRESPLIGQSRETLSVLSNQHAQLAQRLSEARSRRMALEHKLGAYAIAKAESPDREGRIPVIAASLTSEGRTSRLRPEQLPAAADNDPSTNVLRDVSNAEGEDFKEIQLQLWQARVLLKSLANKYTSEHPAMAGAEEQVEYWEDLLQQRVRAAEVGLSHELDAAKTTEANLQKLFDEEQSRVKQVDDFLVEETAMMAKITRAEETHALALARLKEFQLTQAAMEKGRSSVIVRALDGPQLQEEIVWPQPKILLGLSGVLGLVAGVVLVSLRK